MVGGKRGVVARTAVARAAGVMFAAALLAGDADAQDLGARSVGRGGTGRADPTDVAAIAGNLAVAAMTPRYDLFAGSALGPDSRFVLRGGAVDSRTSAWTIGAGYERRTQNIPPTGDDLPGWQAPGDVLDNPSTAQRVYMGAAVPFLEKRYAVALTGRYDWGSSEQGGAVDGFNFGAQVAGRPLEGLTIAAGMRDILGENHPDHARTADLAVRWQPGKFFAIEGDMVAPVSNAFAIDRFGWHVGAEASVIEWLALRGGYENVATTSFATAGLGLGSERISLDYGARVQLDDPARSWHALDLRLVF